VTGRVLELLQCLLVKYHYTHINTNHGHSNTLCLEKKFLYKPLSKQIAGHAKEIAKNCQPLIDSLFVNFCLVW